MSLKSREIKLWFGKHEKGVENFYSMGAEKRQLEADGFLSFGYWTDHTTTYYQAAEKLFEVIFKDVEIPALAHILNVSCGFGAETLRIYKRFHPARLVGVDITKSHIQYAKKKAQEAGLEHAIQFEQGNACQLNYEDNSFDVVVGIEGPSHYNTRLDFFHEAYRVLKPGGTLLLSDIVAQVDGFKLPIMRNIVGRLTAKLWHSPLANQIKLSEYLKQLEKIGFKIERAQSIGEHVFPGFAKYNTRKSELKSAIQTRGLYAGLGITIISYLLGLVYSKGLITYIIVQAQKTLSDD